MPADKRKREISLLITSQNLSINLVNASRIITLPYNFFSPLLRSYVYVRNMGKSSISFSDHLRKDVFGSPTVHREIIDCSIHNRINYSIELMRTATSRPMIIKYRRLNLITGQIIAGCASAR